MNRGGIVTDTSALIEGHYLVTSYPAAWCQCHHPLGWETRAQDHAAHVIATIQAQALRDAAVGLANDGMQQFDPVPAWAIRRLKQATTEGPTT